jgi:hypothetical protein
MKLILNTEIHAYTGSLPVTISAECDSRLHDTGNKISFCTFASHINYWQHSVWHFTNEAHIFTEKEIILSFSEFFNIHHHPYNIPWLCGHALNLHNCFNVSISVQQFQTIKDSYQNSGDLLTCVLHVHRSHLYSQINISTFQYWNQTNH